MKLKTLSALLSTLILSNSAFATVCSESNGTSVYYVTQIQTGGNYSLGTANNAVSVYAIPEDQIGEPTPTERLVTAFSAYDAGNTMGRVILTQIQMAMVNGMKITFSNRDGNCNNDGFTAVYVYR